VLPTSSKGAKALTDWPDGGRIDKASAPKKGKRPPRGTVMVPLKAF